MEITVSKVRHPFKAQYAVSGTLPRQFDMGRSCYSGGCLAGGTMYIVFEGNPDAAVHYAERIAAMAARGEAVEGGPVGVHAPIDTKVRVTSTVARDVRHDRKLGRYSYTRDFS